MIFDYGFSIQGKSHMKLGTGCQDAHEIRQLENGWYVGVIADGVGSCKNAAKASSLASKTVADFICEYMPYDYNLISTKSMLRTALHYAQKTILRQADEENPAETFETTLSAAIYDGKRITYAHCGDGAIIGLTTFGELVEITKRQKGRDGHSLLPLSAGYTSWEIDDYEEDLAGVLLVTDGVLDALSPYLLKIQPSGAPEESDTSEASGCSIRSNSPLYIPLALWLSDPAGLPEDEEGRVILRERIEAFVTADEEYDSDFFYERMEEICRARVPEEAESFLEEMKQNNCPVTLMKGSQDDKTVVGFLNPEIRVDAQPAGYYREPDWNDLQEAWNRLAYPSLYAKKDAEKKDAEKKDEEKKDADVGPEEGSTHVETLVKWMKKWTRLEPQENRPSEDAGGCEVKEHDGSEKSEILQ